MMNIASRSTDDDYWELSYEEIIKHFKEGSKAKGMRGPPRFFHFMWACRKTDKFAGSKEELKLKDAEHAKKQGLEKEWRESDESYKKDHGYGKYEAANAAEEETSPSANIAEIKKYVKKIKKMEAKMKKSKRSPSPPPSSSSEDSDTSDDESTSSSDDESDSDS